MAKKNGWAGLAVAGGIMAAGALMGRKKRKDAERAAEEARKAADLPETQGSDIGMERQGYDDQRPEVQERTCKSCGNVDASGSENCPVCFAPMDPDARQGDFYDL